MGLPQGYEAKTREEWLKIASDTDPMKRKVVGNLLRDLGMQPTEYMSWEPAQRVEVIMKAQGEGGSNGTKSAAPAAEKASTKGAAKAETGGGGGDAALRSEVAALKAEVAELKNVVGEMAAFVKDGHMLLRIFIESDAKMKGNVQDDDVREALYGTLVHKGNG
jgi:hypothetical protein